MITTAIALAACGGSDGGGSAIEQGVEVMATAVTDAGTAACDGNDQVLAAAVDAYATMNGAPPETLDDLVPDWIVEAPTGWTIDAGRVVPTPGGPCDPATTTGD